MEIVAQVAADDPDTEPKIPQPRIVVCISRPGTRLSHGASPLNICSESRVRNRISPIQMNSGSAASSHEAFAFQNAVNRFFAATSVGRRRERDHADAADDRERHADPHADREQHEHQHEQERADRDEAQAGAPVSQSSLKSPRACRSSTART